MKPGGTPESPKISIQGKDVYFLKFGMAGGATLFAPGRDYLLDEFEKQENKEGAAGDYWTETVDIDASPANLALCGLAYRFASAAHTSWVEGRNPDPASVTGAGLAAEKVIIQEGMAVLAGLAGSDEQLQEYMSVYAEELGTQRLAKLTELAFGPILEQ